ncbi:MAG: hypothetical protein QXP91_10580 [Candidatus Methanomethylicia archaeon]
MSSKLEIFLPPTTLPIFHDVMCTALCIAIAEVGSETIRNITYMYDVDKALGKVIIEGDIETFKKKIDELFSSRRLKPSEGISEKWIYEVSKDSVNLEMGGKRFPSPGMGIGRNVAAIIRKQCYLFAKGYQFISIREEEAGPKPMRGHLKIGIHDSIVYLVWKMIRSASRTVNIMGEQYSILLLIGEVPRTVEDALMITHKLYRIDYSDGATINLNEDITKHMLPSNTLNLMLEAPDLVYHNFSLALVKNHIQGLLDVARLPILNVYVFPGVIFNENKDVIVYFSFNRESLQNLHMVIKTTIGSEEASRIINHINRAVMHLGNIVQQTQWRRELAVIETVIPHFRMFLNNLLTGAPIMDSLYTTIRLLTGFEKVDERFRLIAEELTKIVER